MSTRSKIGILRKDGSVDHVYSHWDGYPEHNGVVLIENYNNINKINELIKNGDMSILAEHIYPIPDKAHSRNITSLKKMANLMNFWGSFLLLQ